jgi:hypothetical protein
MGISNNTSPKASAQKYGEEMDTHTTSSSTNATLRKPTSCPIPLLVLSGRSPLLADRAKSSQSVIPRLFEDVIPHSSVLVLIAYPMVGRKAEVQVKGLK